LDGDENNDDVDSDASLESMQTTFEYLAQNLGHDDQLLVHFDTHGNTYDLYNLGSYIDVIGVNGYQQLFDYRLAEWLEPIACAQMLITMQNCFSGGFIDDLTDYETYPNTQCKNRYICTAASYAESSHFERHITGTTPPSNNEVYGEFVFYLYSALRGVYPDVDPADGFDPWLPFADLEQFPFDNFFPYDPNDPHYHPIDYNPDEVSGNNDGFMQVGEAFGYMNNFNTFSPNGYFYPYPDGPFTIDHPQYMQTGLFDADVFTLTGLTGNVYGNSIVSGNFMLSGNITIDETADVEIESSSEFYSSKGYCKLIVNGNASIGSNVSFLTEEEAQIWLVINNTAMFLTINEADFENAAIIAYNEQLTVYNTTLTNSVIYGYDGNFDIRGSHFDNSHVRIITAGENNNMVNISDGCTFTGSGTNAIEIDNYADFNIGSCTISGYLDAINLYNCGYGSSFQLISNCVINDNTSSGITIYRSSADIWHNYIFRNGYGIKCFDRSMVHIQGGNLYITQAIYDNEWYELYASRGSFPQYFHWNLVQDDDNQMGDPLVKYTAPGAGLDVRNNCWGNNFDPLTDLEPSGAYLWNPVWICLGGSGSGSSSEAEALYLDARENIETENFTVAKTEFEQILDEYPATEYAKAAMKELYTLEELTGNNYGSLKEYYNTHTAIQNNPELTKLADFLANFCDIKLENYPTAIAWFEDVILNPETMEDSIFAIIDLGYTYFLMENGGLKSSYTGNLIEHKPVSVEQFEIKRDFLLSLLPGDLISETMKQSINTLKSGELLQNVPNPFNGTTQIWYKLDIEATVTVKVFDYTGKLIKSYDQGTMDKGSYFVKFTSEGLSAGIYFYCLEVNGQLSDSKKMTLMK